MSGQWIHDIATAAVAAVRAAVGPRTPIIGTGGVSSRETFVGMVRAGADAVGVGSALASLHQREWPAFLEEISNRGAGAAVADGPDAAALGSSNMRYTGHTVIGVASRGPTMVEVTLDGRMDAGPGQAVFLWIPGIGEKPFAVALNEPPTFLVRVRGRFTQALAELRPADRLYVRGPYGDRHVPPPAERVLIVAGGTGLAAVSLLARELANRCDDVSLLIGLREQTGPAPLSGDDLLESTCTVVRDEGRPGTVLEHVSAWCESSASPADLFYAAGPEPLTDRAVAIARDAGVPPDAIFVAVERRMMCGVGMCGLCDCGGRLTCQYGTFVTAADLERERLRKLGSGEFND